jgi:hypothetical protein
MKQQIPEAGEPQANPPVSEPHPSGHAMAEKRLQSVTAPRTKVLDGKAIAFDHPDSAVGEVHLMAALGTTDRDLYRGIVERLGDAASYGGDEQALDFMLSVVKSIKPRDQVETMLATQMAEVHVATLTSARQFARAVTVVQQDYVERALNKLARTFATQTEALRRYRSGGEPNVTVRHVSVNDGGQAIVGNVTTSRAAAGRAAPAGANPASTTTSRAARPRAPVPKRPAISTPAPADAAPPPRRQAR